MYILCIYIYIYTYVYVYIDIAIDIDIDIDTCARAATAADSAPPGMKPSSAAQHCMARRDSCTCLHHAYVSGRIPYESDSSQGAPAPAGGILFRTRLDDYA